MFKSKNSTGTTPLDLNDMKGLIPFVKTQEELNALEQENIVKGFLWAERQTNPHVLSFKFCYTLHKKTPNEVLNEAVANLISTHKTT